MSVILAWEVEIRRIIVQGQLGQKVLETRMSTNSWVWWHAPITPAMWEAEIGLMYKPAWL
jgi:hypothetical protein